MKRKRRMPGEGSVFRRTDGRWAATISQGPRGNRKVTTVYRHTRPEALDALAEIRVLAGRRTSGTLTVGTYLERWVRDADVRDTTRRGYQAVIATHLNPNIGHLRLGALSPLHVKRLMADLQPLMKPKTRRNVLVILRRALREAVRSELVSRNVASPEFIDAPKVPAYEPDALTPDEIARILDALTGEPIEAHVIVALGTGLRQGEQLGLAWEDIDDDVIHVRLALARIDGKYDRVAPKTDRSRRDVPLPATVRDALHRHRERLIGAGFVPISTGPVFVNETGGEMSGAVLTHRWQRFLERIGIPRRPWKILRATYGTNLRASGFDEIDIAALLGHARTHTTRKHYLAARDVDPRAAVDAALTRTTTRTVTALDVAGRRSS